MTAATHNLYCTGVEPLRVWMDSEGFVRREDSGEAFGRLYSGHPRNVYAIPGTQTDSFGSGPLGQIYPLDYIFAAPTLDQASLKILKTIADARGTTLTVALRHVIESYPG